MANEYRLGIYDCGDVSETEQGYITYSISPDYGSTLKAGDVVTISGTVFNRGGTIRCIQFYHSFGEGVYGNSIRATAVAGIPQNTPTAFSMSFTVKEEFLSALPQRIHTSTHGSSQFSFWTTPEPDESSFFSDYASYFALDKNFQYVKYRLNLSVLAMDFERANSSGTWANDGQYLQCKTFKLTMHNSAVVGDVTTATILCSGSDGSSRSVNLTQAQLSAALTSAGYSESKPGVFAGITFATGVTYTLTLTIGDAYDKVTYKDTVMRSFARLHLSGAANGGVAVGTFSSATDSKPKFEVAESHESFFYGGITGVTNYTSGEIATGGHWIDGKPIYRMTFKLSVPSNVVGSYQFSTALTSNTVDTLIKTEGIFDYLLNNGDRIIYSYPFSNSVAAYNLFMVLDSRGIGLSLGNNLIEGTKVVVLIIEYTKK